MEDIFVGVWSATAAARMRADNGADLSITLVAPGDDLVIRPRLYEADPHTGCGCRSIGSSARSGCAAWPPRFPPSTPRTGP